MSLTKIATVIARAVSEARTLGGMVAPVESIVTAIVSALALLKALPAKEDGTPFTQAEVVAASLDAHAAWHMND